MYICLCIYTGADLEYSKNFCTGMKHGNLTQYRYLHYIILQNILDYCFYAINLKVLIRNTRKSLSILKPP